MAKIEGLDDLAELYDRFLAGPELGRVVTRGAMNIKKDWRRRWEGLHYAPRLAYAVNYDVEYRVAGQIIAAEIGPDKTKRQGALGNIIEFGSPTSAPHPGGLPALAAEEPRLIEQVERLMVRQLGG